MLDEGLRSGLFLFGMRRTGKTTFSADAAAGYANQLGREVKVEEIQPVLNVMVVENLVMRTGHGVYSVADPFVQEIGGSGWTCSGNHSCSVWRQSCCGMDRFINSSNRGTVKAVSPWLGL
ncbi:hypothetical protein PU634_03760 [Oceanimonas pelagia]|uniref:Uncharacterized protein n=1 Tax=Oceanimonas pelagia TaxID=3028314 RepID=A0AA50KR15_9GAMM|nr:hypothetical protein [Oceanimonas pelagia]WMC11487.1 hypothetical protein PU634_03760 [Oceanimonas pelagia]